MFDENIEKKSLGVVGIVGVPAKYGGFETLIENILEHLCDNFQVTVFCESSSYSEKLKFYKGAKLQYLNYNANGVSSIIFDATSIIRARDFDSILILGVSGAFILPAIRKIYKGKIITNIDGLEWKRDKWNLLTKKFLKLSELWAIKYSDAIISDNYYIQKHVLENYNKESCLIPYGGDHVRDTNEVNLLDNYGVKKDSYFFTVCRIEPENNLDLMIEAFLDSNIDKQYVLIGNFHKSDYGVKLKEKYSTQKNLLMLDPIYQQEILDQLRKNCFYYLHGHSAGGTNPSLVEAMYLGLPIIAYGVSYNRSTTKNKAIYFNTKVELIEKFKTINEDQRISLKREMKKIAEENYIWNRIGEKYISLINSVL
ncbi:DUF1972 domain-containing protein [Echinicola salinicaeni]|uniref:DUF1972 domain-containing protein n=1 Tax=Echinicola salinicaeni TaxID=2762757 RepID=UPI0016451AA9|nr:DUF1972 domain-containing protein [Echinicola salinicaeni]